jgi:tellurite resistance protein
MPVFVMVASVLILIAVVAVGVLYVLFCRSPEKRWKDQVLRLQLLARERLAKENVSLRQLGEQLQREERNLSDGAFHACLEQIPVEQLEAFPGIGSGTTGRLRQSGYTTLAKLQRARIQIHGLGRRRLADIHHAVDRLTGTAWTRFREDPNGPQGTELARRLQVLRGEFEQREFFCRARAQGLEAFLHSLQERVQSAEQITLTGYLGLTKKTVVGAGNLDTPLPNLDVHIQGVDARARQLGRERPRKELEPAWAVPIPAGAAPGVADRSPSPERRPLFQRERTTDRAVPPANGPRPSSNSSQPEVIQLRVPVPTAAPENEPSAMDLTIQLAFAVARADGRLARSEKTLIGEHINKRYSSEPGLLNRARALCAHYEACSIDVDVCLRKIREQLASSDRTSLVDLAVQLAAASGGINPREQELLAKISRVLEVPLPSLTQDPKPEDGITEQKQLPIGATKPEAGTAGSDPRELLEIDPGTALTPDLIRRNFNRLWERFDPEKMTAMGGDFVAMAESRRAVLRVAACSLIAPFGEELEPKTAAAPPRDIRENPDLDQVFGV